MATRFNRYVLKYIRAIPLDNVEKLKEGVGELEWDCELQNIGSDNKAYYLCQELLAGRNKERAMESAKANLPDVPVENMALFTDKGKRLVIL